MWVALAALSDGDAKDLFAHCASLSIDATHRTFEPGNGDRTTGDLSRALALDMAAAGWTPTVENYLGRVPKARILEAVAEAKGERSVQLIAHLKKGDMATEAQRMLDGTGWLPEPLRSPEASAGAVETAEPASDEAALPEFLGGDAIDGPAPGEADFPDLIAAG